MTRHASGVMSAPGGNEDGQLLHQVPTMRLSLTLLFAATLGVASAPFAQTVHQLGATPSTVAYGYYWSDAKPAIRVNLRHVPEVVRPPQETPDPDDDPTREWRDERARRK